MSETLEICGNCQKPIGRLQKACVWRGDVVCEPCHKALESEAMPPLPAAPPPAWAAPPSVAPPRFVAVDPSRAGRVFICPNPHCGYQGHCVTRQNGSVVMLVALLFLLFVPGIIYAVYMMGMDEYCPNCGMKVGATPA